MKSSALMKKPVLRRERQSDKNIFPDNFIFDINNWIMKRGTIHSIEDIIYHINILLYEVIEKGKVSHFDETEKEKLNQCREWLMNISETLYTLPNSVESDTT